MRNDKPLVSVIMPCYNHEEYVGTAIESVLNQTYDNVEFIVADNGSTDNSYEVIRRYEDRITKIIRREKNSPALCSFALAESVTGEYVAFMTSDDYWEPDKLDLQMRAIAENPEVKVCVTWAIQADENLQPMEMKGNMFQTNGSKNRYQWFRQLLFGGNCFAYPSAVVEKNLYYKVFFENIKTYSLMSDWFLWMKALLEAEAYMVEKPLLKLRWHTAAENRNESTLNLETLRRHKNEMSDMVQWLFEHMEDEFFKKAFQEDMIDPLAATHEELTCEKFLLLKKLAENDIVYGPCALHFYYDNGYGSVTSVMEEKYHFYYKDLQAWNATVGIGMRVGNDEKVVQELLQNKHRQEQTILQLKELLLARVQDETDILSIKRQLFGMILQDRQNVIREMSTCCNRALQYLEQAAGNAELYVAMIQLLNNMVENLELVWEDLSFAEFGISHDDWEVYKELLTLAGQEMIDLTEAVIPFTQFVAQQLQVYFEDEV